MAAVKESIQVKYLNIVHILYARAGIHQRAESGFRVKFTTFAYSSAFKPKTFCEYGPRFILHLQLYVFHENFVAFYGIQNYYLPQVKMSFSALDNVI